MLHALDLLEVLSKAASPSGEESSAAGIIRSYALQYTNDITTDAMGNLIVHRPGSGEKVMLAAHMDTIGFIATHVDEKGFVRFGAIGGVSHAELLNIPVRFANGVNGVISCDGNVKASERKLHHYYIDVGASNREDALSLIAPGMRAVFSGSLRKLGGHRVSSPYLDNRAGCAVLLMALSALSKTEYDLYFVFTAQEEVGLRGAACAAFALQPDWALAVDVTDTGDTPSPEIANSVTLGNGPAIKILDRSAVAHPAVIRALHETAALLKLPVQREIMTDGGTDAGVIQRSRGGVATGGIAIPVRYIHSPCETADLMDIENAAVLLTQALEEGAFLA